MNVAHIGRSPRRIGAIALITALVVAHLAWAQPGDHAPLRTRWADDVTPDHVWPEYPRPQMTRAAWTNLNGTWSYAITARDAARPSAWDGSILVPFCVESALSGVQRAVTPEQVVWYSRAFTAPERGGDERMLLHFGAVDWEATVFVNGAEVGVHRGGFDPFSFDITDALRAGAENTITVRVWDPTDTGPQPRGKQTLTLRGIWYTAVTGIWQTVWLETVPATSIRSVVVTSDVAANAFDLTAALRGDDTGCRLDVEWFIDGAHGAVNAPADQRIRVEPPASIPRWSPETPVMHELTITLRNADGRTVDRVKTSFGFREIESGLDGDGVRRVFLNGEPLFLYGTLDQGWWPDGLYTPPTDAALRYDLEVTKQLGFNMVRKHVKVESARFYHWCDVLGLIVWQDMPSGERSIRDGDPDLVRTPESAAIFETELRAMITALRPFTSIGVWVPFNEGWGQYDTARITELTQTLDPSRLVNAVSGWTDRHVGDFHDVHVYPGPGMPTPERKRIAALGEFGGLGLPVAGHLWHGTEHWGYREYETADELTDAYVAQLAQLHRLIGRGLAAAVYTQTTDVEGEVNGVMTYDRAVIKFDIARARAAADALHTPPPVLATVAETARDRGVMWRMTTTPPTGAWMMPEYDDSAWPQHPASFGARGTPGAVVRTTWSTNEIWIRRAFELDHVSGTFELDVHHDEDAEIYINGALAATLTGYTTSYVTIPMTDIARAALRPGRNVIAVHCQQTTGGQNIDVGIVRVEAGE